MPPTLPKKISKLQEDIPRPAIPENPSRADPSRADQSVALADSPGSASSSEVSTANWHQPFEPLKWLPGGHAQTLAGNYWRRPAFALPVEAEPVVVDPADGSRVLCHGHWQPRDVRPGRLTILLVHGLEGSSESRYMQGISQLAWLAGCNVIRMNMRNCGGTEQWTPTLYHSGLSADVDAVLHHFVRLHRLERVAMAGYSMGGNLVLKLAGDLGSRAPEWLMGAVGVSPATDLAASADALHEPANRFYEWHFLRNLMRRFARKAALFPAIYATEDVGPVRTIREFDDRITARYSGFANADDYYFRASSARVVSRIAIPTLVLHALDDPFIRMMPDTRAALIENSNITLIETQHGGHCAFLSGKSGPAESANLTIGRHSRHWAEATLVRFLMATVGHAHGS
jgi:predicted alpha/beta-fold hydrolase